MLKNISVLENNLFKVKGAWREYKVIIECIIENIANFNANELWELFFDRAFDELKQGN
jgi:hypothetical protein